MAIRVEMQHSGNNVDSFADWTGWVKNREFVSNSGGVLVYEAGGTKITLTGYIASTTGEEPKEWDLNNSQITEIDISRKDGELSIQNIAMSLREIFAARALEDYRDWNIISDCGKYVLRGCEGNDKLSSAETGHTTIQGRGGDDRLVSRGEFDQLRGGHGDDHFVLRDGFGSVMRGGDGADTFVLKISDARNVIEDLDFRADAIDLRYYLAEHGGDRATECDVIKVARDGHFDGNGVEVSLIEGADAGVYDSLLRISVDGVEEDLISVMGGVDLREVNFIF